MRNLPAPNPLVAVSVAVAPPDSYLAGRDVAATTAPSERQRQRLSWERTAAGISDLWGAPSTQYYRRREMELISRAFGPLAGKRVLKLDLWNEAFNTRIGHWLEEQGAELFAFDLSKTVTARARQESARIRRQSAGAPRLACADIREFPFADRSFDFVYTMGTIEHIPEYRQALGEILRVLREGGRAIVGVPHRWDPFLRPLLVGLLAHFGKYPYAPEKSFGSRELRRDLEGAGFEVLERTGILALPGFVRLLDLFCHTRGIPLDPLWAALIAPFGFCERRFSAARRLGYLMAMVAQRPAGG